MHYPQKLWCVVLNLGKFGFEIGFYVCVNEVLWTRKSLKHNRTGRHRDFESVVLSILVLREKTSSRFWSGNSFFSQKVDSKPVFFSYRPWDLSGKRV
jgi:hypothetical protein